MNRWLDADDRATLEMPALPPNGHEFWRMSKADQAAYLAKLDETFRSSLDTAGR